LLEWPSWRRNWSHLPSRVDHTSEVIPTHEPPCFRQYADQVFQKSQLNIPLEDTVNFIIQKTRKARLTKLTSVVDIVHNESHKCITICRRPSIERDSEVRLIILRSLSLQKLSNTNGTLVP
jgi:hypothetical protein